jgi:methionyl-tRNA formyltransferase
MSALSAITDRSSLRLIMMGTGDFAVPTFRLLLDRGFDVRLLVTQPDRPQGRHQELLPAAIKQLAVARGIAVFQPDSVNTPESIARLAALQPDLFVVAAYGQILSDDLLNVPRLGGVNLHASLLPKYRGAAPINWAIYHGESVTGVTVIQMNPRVDAGAILLQAETPIGPDETAGDLEVRLAELGAPLVADAIDGLAAGTLVGHPQDRSLATRAPKLKKEHGLIDWTRDAAAVCNQIRAMQPWPMAYTFLHRADSAPPERIIIERAHVAMIDLDSSDAEPRPGAVVTARPAESKREGRLVVCAGTTTAGVEVDRLRPAGKRTMSVTEFLRGNPLTIDDRFGGELA